MTYGEKLKDPRWQKKRLEILQRDNFTCDWCGEESKTLHVHHLCYLVGKEPWEVDAAYLVTLCEDCHKVEHSGLPAILNDILINLVASRNKLAVRVVVGVILDYQTKTNA